MNALLVAVFFNSLLTVALLTLIGLWAWRRVTTRIAWVRQTWAGRSFARRTRMPPSLGVLPQYALLSPSQQHSLRSPPNPDWMEQLEMDPATLTPTPRRRGAKVDLTAHIGRDPRRSMSLAMPVIIAPASDEQHLSAEIRVALAQAATLTGIAVVSGVGPYFAEERAYAQRWILREGRGHDAYMQAVRGVADMIEIPWGLAADSDKTVASSRTSLPQGRVHTIRGQVRVREASWSLLGGWVQRVRHQRPDCPLAVKLPASQHLEEDLAYLLTLPIDAVSLDGTGSESQNSHHLGIAAALATHRAHKFLVAGGQRERLTLIIAGEPRSTADMMRLLALGADVVVLGVKALMTPYFFENPRFHGDVHQASEHVVGELETIRAEMAEILRDSGFASIRDWRESQPLVARTREAAAVFHIPYDGMPSPPRWVCRMQQLTQSYKTLNEVLQTIQQGLQIMKEIHKESR